TTDDFKEIADKYFQAEQILARAKGQDVVANLEKLRQQPLASLPARFERNFASNLEAHRLREFILETRDLRRDAVVAINSWPILSGRDKELAEDKRSEKLSDAVRPIAKQLHDFLKPRAMLREGGLSPDDRSLVEVLEQRLAL